MFTPTTHQRVTKVVAHKRLNLLLDNSEFWVSGEDLAKVFDIDLCDVVSVIHEYYLSVDNDISNTMKKVYNKQISHYENYYNLEVVIWIGYRVSNYKVVREFVRLKNTLKTTQSVTFSSEDDDLDVDSKIKVVSKALELIRYMKEWQNNLVH